MACGLLETISMDLPEGECEEQAAWPAIEETLPNLDIQCGPDGAPDPNQLNMSGLQFPVSGVARRLQIVHAPSG